MRFIQRLGTPCCPIPSKEHFTTLQILTEMLGDYSIDQKFFHSNNGLNWIEGQDSNEQTKAIVLANNEYLFQMNITANNIYSSPADPISNDLDIEEYLSLLKNYSSIEYYYPIETLSLVGQEVHTQAITIEGDVQVFKDQQCTEYATGAEQTVYVRFNTPVGFGEGFTVGDGSVQGDYFSITTPYEGHEDDPYCILLWVLGFSSWGSDDFAEAFTEGQIVKCVNEHDFDPVENPTTVFSKPKPEPSTLFNRTNSAGTKTTLVNQNGELVHFIEGLNASFFIWEADAQRYAVTDASQVSDLLQEWSTSTLGLWTFGLDKTVNVDGEEYTFKAQGNYYTLTPAAGTYGN